MDCFEIIAHRGNTTVAPENTIASFRQALDLGADGVELDVRLTADRIPVVYHYFCLENNTSISGPIFCYTLDQLRDVEVYCKGRPEIQAGKIPTLIEVLDLFAGKMKLEIHMQGPEPEAPELIGRVLHDYHKHWGTFEVTSYEPAMLLAFQKECPSLATDLLFPRSEKWMTLEVVEHIALHHSRLARARAVHLHPTQLSNDIVIRLRKHGIEIHAWDVNDEEALETALKYQIPRICTDNLKQAIAFRERAKE